MAYVSAFPSGYSTTTVKSTTDAGANYRPWLAADPSKSVVAGWSGNSWLSNAVNNSQRWHLDLGTGVIIKRIYYENAHDNGSFTDAGARAFTFWGSNDGTAFTTLTYATDTNWTQLTSDISEFVRHPNNGAADPQYALITNSTAYRYYAIKIATNWGRADYLGIRRFQLQYDDTPSGGYAHSTAFLSG